MTVEIKDTMLYPVADLLSVNLNDMGNIVRGFETRKVSVGPWQFECDVSVVSDILTPRCCTFFAKIVGGLWLYVINRVDHPLTILALDGASLKLHVKDVASFGGKSLEHSLGKLVTGIVAGYEFDDFNKKWVSNDSGYLEFIGDLGKLGQDAPLALPAPKSLPESKGAGG